MLDPMSGTEFEEFVARLLAKLDYGEVEWVPHGADMGRDILVRSRAGLTVIECKHHPNGSIGRPVVQKLHSAVISSRGVKGIIVTTGHFSPEALAHAQTLSPPIEMIDHALLADMASRAGIRLVTGKQDLRVSTYAIPPPETTWASLGSYLGSFLTSHPNAPAALIREPNRTLHYEPFYVVTYDVNATFETTVGVIHREFVQGWRLALDGTTGTPMDPAILQFLGGETHVPFMGAHAEFRGTIPNFRIDATSVRAMAKSAIIRMHTRTKTYTGRNNQTYNHICQPPERTVFISDISQAFVPFLSVTLRLLKTPYDATVVQGPSGRILPRTARFHVCGVCKAAIHDSPILCNVCGQIAHAGGFFVSSIHGFRCKRCGRTTCRHDGNWTRRRLLFKALLCPPCTQVARNEGKRVTALGALAGQPSAPPRAASPSGPR
jgi:hypothetical protein